MTTNSSLAVVDLGGQYCHLIARRLRDLGAQPHIYPPSVSPAELKGCVGIVLSGGPRSVYDGDAPKINPSLLRLGVPVLGICYGHQLLAKLMGAEVSRGAGEYGRTVLSLQETDSLFVGTPTEQTVWMSHSDSVGGLPNGAVALASTPRCKMAAFADLKDRLFGVQFHPEVVHTQFGSQILGNFVHSICGVNGKLDPAGRVNQLLEEVRAKVVNKSVFFLVSGGVDSTVAFALCARVLPRERILGLYVDTGLMRKGETQELLASLDTLGLADRVRVLDRSDLFLDALDGVTDPEEKRHVIGRLFVDVQAAAVKEFGIEDRTWLLGQGTIYPDTIESGGATGRAALIKTHHNRCPEIRQMLLEGRVIEPLADLYKDEVRQAGRALGLSRKLINRWPFPGPGLAIRLLCSTEEAGALAPTSEVARTAQGHGYDAVILPIQSVGVQGDSRTYRQVVALRGPVERKALEAVSTDLCNLHTETNRAIVHLCGSGEMQDARVVRKGITRERLETLREADYVARSAMEEMGITEAVWQFPVVQLPVSFSRGETIVLRPVNSEDGMTANFAWLPADALMRIAENIGRLPGVDAVFLDVTNKPPATIEWE